MAKLNKHTFIHKKHTFALASRVASASAAIARCMFVGKRTSLTSTRSTL